MKTLFLGVHVETKPPPTPALPRPDQYRRYFFETLSPGPEAMLSSFQKHAVKLIKIKLPAVQLVHMWASWRHVQTWLSKPNLGLRKPQLVPRAKSPWRGLDRREKTRGPGASVAPGRPLSCQLEIDYSQGIRLFWDLRSNEPALQNATALQSLHGPKTWCELLGSRDFWNEWKCCKTQG